MIKTSELRTFKLVVEPKEDRDAKELCEQAIAVSVASSVAGALIVKGVEKAYNKSKQDKSTEELPTKL